MDKVQAFWGVVRHALGIAGGALVALGLTTTTDWTQLLTSVDGVVGGGLAAAAIVGSILNKVKGFSWSNIFKGGDTTSQG